MELYLGFRREGVRELYLDVSKGVRELNLGFRREGVRELYLDVGSATQYV